MAIAELLSLPVAILLGALAGLGLGGGSLLVLWLTVVCAIEPEQAKMINLLFFLPSALISTLWAAKKGGLNLRPLLPAIVCGCISALVFGTLSAGTDPSVLKKGFGILLLYTGLRQLFYRDKKAR